jgi:hypothetical protein
VSDLIDEECVLYRCTASYVVDAMFGRIPTYCSDLWIILASKAG